MLKRSVCLQEETKRDLQSETGLTATQINNWCVPEPNTNAAATRCKCTPQGSGGPAELTVPNVPLRRLINQRKRHWHKLFGNGGHPETEEAAKRALVKRYGSLEKAVSVIMRAW